MAGASRPQVGAVEAVTVRQATAQAQRDANLAAVAATGRKPNPRSQPGAPGIIFKRSDSPFTSTEGTHVTLLRAAGVTKRGFLTVPFRFQIPPIDGWQRSFSGRWTNFDVVGGKDGPAERTRFGGPGLRTVSFRTCFMDWHPSWGVWEPDLLEPILAVRELENLARKGIIFSLRVRDDGLYDHNDVAMLATIVQGDVESTAGEPDSRYITLSFQEYDELDEERKRRQAGAGAGGEPGPWTHTIAAGDTLYSLARFYYQTQTGWRWIASANKGLENWAPSRALTEWAAQSHRTRITVPQRPHGTAKTDPSRPNVATGVGRV